MIHCDVRALIALRIREPDRFYLVAVAAHQRQDDIADLRAVERQGA